MSLGESMPSLLVERIGWTLIHFVWEGLLVALVLAVGLFVARRKSANVRYGMACVALVLLATLPVATFFATQPAEPTAIERQTAHGTQRVLELPPAARVRPIDIAVQPYLPGLVVGWALGASLLALRLLGAFAQIQRLRRKGKPATAEWEALFQEAMVRIGVWRRVKLLSSDRVQVPCAFGIFRAVVILPTEMLTRLPADYIQALMLHELAHVRRHDYLVNLLQSLLETLLFYHPAVWWVSRVVRDEREHCCDDIAARAFGDPVRYARALTRLEEHRKALPRFSLAANGGTLLARIQRLLGIPMKTRLAHPAWPLAAILVFAITATSAAMQTQSPQHKTSTHHSRHAKKPTKLSAKPVGRVVQKVSSRSAGTNGVKAAISSLHNVFAVRNVAVAPAKMPVKTSASPVLPIDTRADRFVERHGVPVSSGSGPKAFVPGEPKIADLGNGRVSVSLTKSWASDSILALAKAAKLAVVIGQIEEVPLTIHLPDYPADEALEMMVREAGLSLRRDQGRTWFVEAKGKQSDTDATVGDPQHIFIKLDGVEMSKAAMSLAKASGRSIVVTPSQYGQITLSLNDVTYDEAVLALCAAAEHATYRNRGAITYILPGKD